MKNLVPQLARKPYLTPDSSNAIPVVPMYSINESSDSLYIADSQMNVRDLSEKLATLERNEPFFTQLQEAKLGPGPKKRIHDGSFPIWLTQLQDPSIHPYSLVPFPNIDPEVIPEILKHCLEYRVLPDRASWVFWMIYYTLHPQHDLSADIKKLITTENEESLMRISRFCYDKNLFNHGEFIDQMISSVSPDAMRIFQDQIIRTHTLLKKCINQQPEKFLSIFSEDLIKQRTHLIQFSVLCNINANNEPLYHPLHRLIEPSKILMKRAKRIYNTITPTRLSIQTQLKNIIVSQFPYFEISKLRNDVMKCIVYMEEGESSEVAASLLELIFWFNDKNVQISSVVAHTIKMIKPKPDVFLSLFIRFVYQNVEDVTMMRYIFICLQQLEVINYTGFISRIKQLGYFITEKEKTRAIVCNLPFIGRSKQSATSFSDSMKRVDAVEYDEILFQFTQMEPPMEKRVLENMELAKKLPFSAAYGLGTYIVASAKDFSEAAEVIFDLELNTLFLKLLDRVANSSIAFDVTRIILPNIMTLMPFIVLNGKLKIITEQIANNTTKPVFSELGTFIQDHFKKVLEENIIRNAKSQKIETVDPDKVRDLFRRYSYLCSLHVFDAFHNVEKLSDFDNIFKIFMMNLLQFYSLKARTLMKFFLEFSKTAIVQKPTHYFIKSMISILMNYPDEVFDDHLNELLELFFTEVFKREILQPHEFLAECKNNKKKLSPANIFRVFLSIVHNNHELFTPSNCFTENALKNLIQEPALLSQLLQELSDCPVQQLTDDLLDAFNICNTKPITLAGVFFSLLPEEARSKDFDTAFNFYKENATPRNTRFLAYWLKMHAFYSQPQTTTQQLPEGIPVLFVNDKINNHAFVVANAFFELFNSLNPEDPESEEKSDTYLNGWSLICQVEKGKFSSMFTFANEAVKIVTQHIRSSDFSFSKYILDYIHPAILISPPEGFDQLVDSFNAIPLTVNSTLLPQIASSVFCVYLTRSLSVSQMRVEEILSRLLQLLTKLYETSTPGIDSLIDAFNFIICYSSTSPISQLQLHMSIKEYYLNLPKAIQNLIVLNVPPQTFVDSTNPLYCDVVLDQQPYIPPQPQLQVQMPQQQITSTYYNDQTLETMNDLPMDDDFGWFN